MKQRFTELGRYYGYPQCCIDEFINFVCLTYLTGKPHIREKRKFNGTGYVPCVVCNMKATDELLSEISKNRKHDKPFPNQE